jgi:hypothetical protein
MDTTKTNDWWVEYKTATQGGGSIPRPFTPGKKPIQSASKPAGNFAGPYCCEACAADCVNFGASEERARAANHGTSDEQFCAWLGAG